MKVLERAGEGKRLRARVTSLLGSRLLVVVVVVVVVGGVGRVFSWNMCTVNEVTEEKMSGRGRQMPRNAMSELLLWLYIPLSLLQGKRVV